MEQDIPDSVLVRVYILGPLEIWKKDSFGAWKLVSEDKWKKSRPARSVLKRLLVQPGRRLSREQLADDVWSESGSEPTGTTVYNAISLIRGVIGKSLVKLWGSAYEIAGQTLVWTDIDACDGLLKEAENQGHARVQALPLLEQALTLLERGELLEGEYGKWCYQFRKRAEDMLKQARLWLVEGYERQGKLWQAGEQYRAMILTNPSDEDALRRWLEMLARHDKRQEALKCYQDMKDFVEAQGFPLSSEIEQVATSLNGQPHRALLVPSQTIQIVSPPSLEQSNHDLFVLTDSDVSDRLAKLLTKSSITRAEEIMYFDQQTRFYWRTREKTVLSIATLYSSIVIYINDLTMALACSHLPALHQQLCEIISRTVLLAGILLYDMGQYTKARENYQIAFQAANEAGNPVLQAIIWGWTSFTWTYSQHYQKALYCIQYARHLATPTPDICVQAWLAAIEAEIQSHLLNRDACEQWLTTLDHSLDILPSPDTAYLFEFNPVLLLGYKGVCLQRLYQKQEPETHVFLREAKEALEQALESEAPLKRKLYYLSDLASVYARQGEVEKACAYVTQSLPTVLQIGDGSKTIHKHLFQVRTLLQPYKSVASVQTLDEQLNLLHLSE